MKTLNRNEDLRTEEPKAEDDSEAGPLIIPKNNRILGEIPAGSPQGVAHAPRLACEVWRE